MCVYVNVNLYKYVGPLYCQAEMYAGRVACCPLVSHGEYADWTDRQTDDARPLHYAFRSSRPVYNATSQYASYAQTITLN